MDDAEGRLLSSGNSPGNTLNTASAKKVIVTNWARVQQ